jgi:hypothetical protein
VHPSISAIAASASAFFSNTMNPKPLFFLPLPLKSSIILTKSTVPNFSNKVLNSLSVASNGRLAIYNFLPLVGDGDLLFEPGDRELLLGERELLLGDVDLDERLGERELLLAGEGDRFFESGEREDLFGTGERELRRGDLESLFGDLESRLGDLSPFFCGDFTSL